MLRRTSGGPSDEPGRTGRIAPPPRHPPRAVERWGLALPPAGALSEADREFLAGNRDGILALFESDPIGWRAPVMAAQVPRTGALPLLLARPGIRFPPGSCCSCGDPRPADRYRCAPCAAATVRALAAAQAAGTVA
jgi:hypothetical protein